MHGYGCVACVLIRVGLTLGTDVEVGGEECSLSVGRRGRAGIRDWGLRRRKPAPAGLRDLIPLPQYPPPPPPTPHVGYVIDLRTWPAKTGKGRCGGLNCKL